MLFFLKNTLTARKSMKETSSPTVRSSGHRQGLPVKIAARWCCRPLIKNLTVHYNSQVFVSFLLFSLGSLKTPLNKSKLVQNLSLLFSPVICCDFIYQTGLEMIDIWLMTCYVNLTPTYPLSRLLN